MISSRQILAVMPLLTLCTTAVLGDVPEPQPLRAPVSDRLLTSIKEPALYELVDDVLARNPGLRSAAAEARAAAERAPQVRALPDPVAGVTAFLATPETRTGPQLFSLSLIQGLPWFGKLELKEKAALLAASALELEIAGQELRLVTETRRLYYELAFLERHREVTQELRSHLVQHEEIARGRYATGVGSGQGVIKLQAEITKVERDLLDINERWIARVSELNVLRERPASAPLPRQRLPATGEVAVALESAVEQALSERPELRAADTRIARAETLVDLAELGRRADFKVGLAYTVVDPRDDAAGRAQPPAGNGDDILAIQGGVTIPFWRKKIAAGVTEALELVTAAEERKRGLAAGIETTIGNLAQRLPLDWQQLRLLEDLLIVQAEEALDSAQAGYIASTLNALDLLDAEHVLFQAQTATARAHADYLIGVAQLEGALAAPLASPTTTERSDP